VDTFPAAREIWSHARLLNAAPSERLPSRRWEVPVAAGSAIKFDDNQYKRSRIGLDASVKPQKRHKTSGVKP
jgi:hypothetical protein